jgi:serine phosphatase RsbU (regulator of sigma subunit)
MARLRDLSLGVKLILATSVLLALAVGTSAFFGYRSFGELARTQAEDRRDDHEAAILRQTQLLVSNIAFAAAIPLSESNFPYLGELVDKAAKDTTYVQWIVVIDALSGQEVARTQAAPTGPDSHRALLDRLAARPTSTEILEARDSAEATQFVVATNIVTGDRAAGRLLLGITMQELERAKAAAIAKGEAEARDSARQQLAVAAIILLLGIGLAYYEGRRIAGPLEALSQQAQHIASGDFDKRVPVTSGDEIGRLAVSFNTMAESLDDLLKEQTRKASLEREFELARDVQQRMSPPPDRVATDFCELAGRCEMAEACGGDWWTYRRLADGRLLVVVGDATGHGMPAAMVAATASGALSVAISQTTRSDTMEPGALLEALDRAIAQIGNYGMTCFAMELGPEGRLRFANAGHTFPYVLRGGDTGRRRNIRVLAARGNPLGASEKKITIGQDSLEPGDVIVLTSDGVVDRLNQAGERYGDRRLRKMLSGSAATSRATAVDVTAMRDQIVDEVESFAHGAPLDDDMTLVVIGFKTRQLAAVGGAAA